MAERSETILFEFKDNTLAWTGKKSDVIAETGNDSYELCHFTERPAPTGKITIQHRNDR